MFKKSLAILAVIILIGIIAFYGLTLPNKGAPKIVITPNSYNFGDIPKEPVKHTFIVKNIGTTTLEIKRVSTSCACTKATIDAEKIAPGQSANLLVTFDPNLMDNIEENVFRIVYVKSNDPEQPEVEIEIGAKVLL